MSYNDRTICAGVPVSANLQLENESQLAALYLSVRNQTMALCAPLEIEDYQIQPMDDASPPKWHLAHVTWFFETLLLKPFSNNYRVFDPSFELLFNSYYNGVGKPYSRANRGFLSRPTLSRVLEYRHYVDEKMLELIQTSMKCWLWRWALVFRKQKPGSMKTSYLGVFTCTVSELARRSISSGGLSGGSPLRKRVSANRAALVR